MTCVRFTRPAACRLKKLGNETRSFYPMALSVSVASETGASASTVDSTALSANTLISLLIFLLNFFSSIIFCHLFCLAFGERKIKNYAICCFDGWNLKYLLLLSTVIIQNLFWITSQFLLFILFLVLHCLFNVTHWWFNLSFSPHFLHHFQ